eukprot:scaffold60234_cov60-Attheya_sp.AAC.3
MRQLKVDEAQAMSRELLMRRSHLLRIRGRERIMRMSFIVCSYASWEPGCPWSAALWRSSAARPRSRGTPTPLE